MDHVLPELLLDDDEKRQTVITEYGLPKDFNINGYGNWLPCHNRCNQSKGKKTPVFVPGNKAILDRLQTRVRKAQSMALLVSSNVAKDTVFKTIFAALEQQTISVRDLDELVGAFADDPAKAGVPEDFIILDSGYWVARDQIVREGICRCDRTTCVGRNDKVYCYFEASLSSWVVNTGLFWRCYDEIVSCPRCSEQHKRGHIGRQEICGRPYLNQESQRD